MKKLMGGHLIFVLALFLCLPLSMMAQEKKEAEGVYTIKQGDTLWDISAKFLKDPFLWPQLWQRNPYITNPHWIYPGNPVRLSPPEEVKEVKKEEPKKIVEEKPREVKEVKEVKEVAEVKKVEPPPVVEKKPEVIEEKKPIKEKKMVFREIRSAGFIAGVDYRGIGTILDSKEGKTLMAEGDVVYLELKTSAPILIGDKYTVIRGTDVIRDPVTEKRVGRRYSIAANIQIIDQSGGFYTARVIESFHAIWKGDLVNPYMKEKMEIEEAMNN